MKNCQVFETESIQCSVGQSVEIVGIHLLEAGSSHFRRRPAPTTTATTATNSTTTATTATYSTTTTSTATTTSAGEEHLRQVLPPSSPSVITEKCCLLS